jgi:hypothetical protein
MLNKQIYAWLILLFSVYEKDKKLAREIKAVLNERRQNPAILDFIRN